MKKLSLAAAIGLSTSMMVSGLALAAEAEMPQFAALDQNMDGQLSAEEASGTPALTEKWAEIDTDESGTIDQVEFSAFEPVQGTEEVVPTSDEANGVK